MRNYTQSVFITLPLNHQYSSYIGRVKQLSYQRILWMFRRSLSIKETANFWSSSPNANNSGNAWQLNFSNGNDNNNNRNNSNRVRLVRLGT